MERKEYKPVETNRLEVKRCLDVGVLILKGLQDACYIIPGNYDNNAYYTSWGCRPFFKFDDAALGIYQEIYERELKDLISVSDCGIRGHYIHFKSKDALLEVWKLVEVMLGDSMIEHSNFELVLNPDSESSFYEQPVFGFMFDSIECEAERDARVAAYHRMIQDDKDYYASLEKKKEQAQNRELYQDEFQQFVEKFGLHSKLEQKQMLKGKFRD